MPFLVYITPKNLKMTIFYNIVFDHFRAQKWVWGLITQKINFLTILKLFNLEKFFIGPIIFALKGLKLPIFLTISFFPLQKSPKMPKHFQVLIQQKLYWSYEKKFQCLQVSELSKKLMFWG